ncbi:DNA-binding LacI/PurR family transcriptional regulator [Microterricola gilva]|uniref:DNA-binding LacI/PurR family transcriptional regulator n=1 Tax=Microterricola gilva TaxID=393267 RepID=A0A4Q8AK60_9MICO|nr:LacI family DNA-binding transcriptional regulator [Microterricola gilva]RZU64245.1 DNA-binding LacI/PurR family transcriptional regulator [Microterricola gilva]
MPRTIQENRQPSQLDVARAAGVSAQTVSRVMSGQPNVRPATVRRVLAAVDELGYRVHAAAVSLASGRTRVLGVIAVSTARYSSGALSVGIETIAAAEGYTVTTALVADHASPDAFLDAFDRLERQGAEGVILLAPVTFLDNAIGARAERTPTVLMHRLTGGIGTDTVVDQAAIARMATEHLLSLGHRTVWHVSGDDYWVESRVRRQAWEQVLTEHGITPPPVIPADWTPESGYRAGRTIAAIPGATAVFVSSDEMAFGVIRALHESGRAVPEDVSIVSVDDIALAAYAAPALTTVRQPFEAVGKAAATAVIDMVEHREPRPFEAIHPELIVRASTAPPRSA